MNKLCNITQKSAMTIPAVSLLALASQEGLGTVMNANTKIYKHGVDQNINQCAPKACGNDRKFQMSEKGRGAEKHLASS